jgi:malonyl-CoA/methylmalonyl-CoA synthetase
MAPHFLHELRTTFSERADHVSVIHQGRSWTYAELDDNACRVAALLQQRGMEKEDRIVIATSAKLPFLIAHLATLFGGGISLPLNPRFTREEMRHFLTDSEARLAIVGAEQFPLFESLRSELPHLKAVLSDQLLLNAPAASWTAPAISSDDPCLMIYSSGTTGWPKGIVHTHANVASSLRALQQCWHVTSEDVVVNVLPLFHIHGLSFATQLTLLARGCVILEDSFDAERTLDVIGRGTIFMAVPTIYYRFLEQAQFIEKARSWSNVRLFTCGSAPIRPEVLPRLEEILGKPIINRYGMSEGFVLTSLPLDGPWPNGSVGLPLRGIELRILKEDGLPAAVGEVGSVQVRGPNLFREYWRNPEATHKAFAPLTLPSPPDGGEGRVRGWFDTGDLGYQDAAGFLFLVGRSNDLIITAGYNIYPQVVERVLNACPGVLESAVVGIPDPMRGEQVAAFVVRADPSLDEPRLQAFIAERLIDYQRPRRVFFIDSLPRNTMGKILRRELIQRLQS